MQVNLSQRLSQYGAGSHSRGYLFLLATLLAMSLSFVGCEEQAIENHTVPKDAPAMIDDHAGHDHSPQPRLSVPEGWQAEHATSSMIFAAFGVGEANNTVRVTVTPLGGDGGGLLQNVNRWRGQVGLPPVDALDKQPTEKLTVDGQATDMFDLVGSANDQGSASRILVAVVARSQQSQTWFFKMAGPDKIVGQHKQEFVRFVESFGFSGGH